MWKEEEQWRRKGRRRWEVSRRKKKKRSGRGRGGERRLFVCVRRRLLCFPSPTDKSLQKFIFNLTQTNPPNHDCVMAGGYRFGG